MDELSQENVKKLRNEIETSEKLITTAEELLAEIKELMGRKQALAEREKDIVKQLETCGYIKKRKQYQVSSHQVYVLVYSTVYIYIINYMNSA